MRLEELASLMKISRDELVEQLKQNDVIELRLNERNSKEREDECKIEIV
jgi:hypothetical protein